MAVVLAHGLKASPVTGGSSAGSWQGQAAQGRDRMRSCASFRYLGQEDDNHRLTCFAPPLRTLPGGESMRLRWRQSC